MIRVPELADNNPIGLPATRVLYLDQVQQLVQGPMLPPEQARVVEPDIFVLLTKLIEHIDSRDGDNGAV